MHRPTCYRQALKTLPTDLRVYSSAPDDIRHALTRQLAHRASRRLTAYGVAGARAERRVPPSSSATPVALIILAAAVGALAIGTAAARARRR